MHAAAVLVEVEGDEGERRVVVRQGVAEVRVRYYLKEERSLVRTGHVHVMSALGRGGGPPEITQ